MVLFGKMPEHGGLLYLVISEHKGWESLNHYCFLGAKGSNKVQHCQTPLLFKINFVTEQLRGNQRLHEWGEAGSKK